MGDLLEEKMLNFTNAVRDSIKDRNWYSSLTLALTLPDICGRLEFPERSSSKRYVHWFEEYLMDKYTSKNPWVRHVFLNGEDAYALRCAYLHQGESNIEEQRMRKVLSDYLFVEPPSSGMIHCNQINHTLQLQVDVFCTDICDGVDEWVKCVGGNKVIQQRAEKLVTIHRVENGFSF